MILSSLSLRNFRIHKNANLNFSDKINYIMGGNGQGKTSILEAAYYLCTTKSFFARDQEAVSFDESDFEIKGTFKDKTNDLARVFFSMPENRKYFFQNDKLISKTQTIIGKYPVVLLVPADHAITQGAPSERRKFIDSVISQASSTYLTILIDYSRTLKHRAVVLSRLRESWSGQLSTELDAWTQRLVESGAEIIKHRKSFIAQFNGYIKESYSKIMSESEHPSVKYIYFDPEEYPDITERFMYHIGEKRNEEIRRSTNLVGPHRDDFVFGINGISLKTFGSQGQHKTFQAALRFAEFFYLKEITGKSPVFLLDDAFGELDSYRAGKISQYLKEVGQTFITITDFTDLSFLTRSSSDLVVKLKSGSFVYA